jgi:hypothetical protein
MLKITHNFYFEKKKFKVPIGWRFGAVNECVYFDSICYLPPPEFITWTKNEFGGWSKIQRLDLPKPKTETCGWLVLSYIWLGCKLYAFSSSI